MVGVECCEAYLDDVYSYSWTEHVAHRCIVRCKSDLEPFEVRVWKKYDLVLGYVVGCGVVRLIGAKVGAILCFGAPSYRWELKRFLDMVGYYKRFCFNFATIAETLTNSPNVTFVWN